MKESKEQKDQCESAKAGLSAQSSSGGHSQDVVIKHRDKTQQKTFEGEGTELKPETQQGELPPSDESKACTTSGKDKEKKSVCEEKSSDLDEDAPTGYRVSDVA